MQKTRSEAQKPAEVFAAYNDPFLAPERRQGPPIFAGAIRKVDDWLTETNAMLSRLEGRPVELVWGMKDVGLGNEETIARWLHKSKRSRRAWSILSKLGS